MVKSVLVWSAFFYSSFIFEVIALDRGVFEFEEGYYEFIAKSENHEGQLSGLGHHRIGYRHPLFQQMHLIFGYSLLASNVIDGDLAFGVDIGADYFPLGSSVAIEGGSENVFFRMQELVMPYIGGNFIQRQFQTISGQVAGFGVRGGAIYAFSNKLSAKAEIKYGMLSGGKKITATEKNWVLAILYNI